ncbi:SDR family NAD(P)-dependent oxidoreductase [Streptomyces sp. NPDC058287]|uniref:SDR family NAD(P)-dependent oxidoreductase n=1 Tax=unclassified Streptomyces TaxID=2593676 RepID=UPI0036E58DEE
MARIPRSSALDGLSALVTGGSRGLGLLLSARLAVRGCRVTVLARDTDELRRATEWIEERTGTAVSAVACDVRDRAAVGAAVRQTYERTGLDIVIANAGVIQVAPTEAIEADAFDDAMATIFGGALNTALAALPLLRRSPVGGRLGLIGSVGGLLAVPHLLPYSCAKAALGALGEGLRAETAAENVSVTTVHPGLMRTGSHLQAEFGGRSSEEFAWFSALAGAPVVSMNAERAAERVVRAVERRRTRLVLTPAARAASLAHGIAPAAVTRMSGLVNRLLPGAETGHENGADDIVQGHRIDRPSSGWTEKLRGWGSALNDRAARRYNQDRAGPTTTA